MLDKYFIIDFDSTFVQIETLEELAHIALKDNLQRESIVKKMATITQAGMDGQIPYSESLASRLKLFQANREHINILVDLIRKQITASILRNRNFFVEYAPYIYIISGGFTEYITPIVAEFNIAADHVLANTFIFNKQGVITGFDKKNPLSQSQGKIKQLENLKLKGEIYVIGDGYTDYEIRKAGLAHSFHAFVENVNRSKVTKMADYIAPNLDDFLYRYRLPRAYSYPKNRIKALLLENIHPTAHQALESEGYQVESLKTALSEPELIERIRDISVLGIRSKTEVTAKVLEHAKKLLVIGAFSIGTNQIDIAQAASKGIAVFNAPYSNTRSVVELILGEILMLHRQTFDKSQKLHKGIWDKSAKGCHEIRRRKLGIIGYGNIGSQLSVLAENLGMEVYFYNTSEKLALGNARKCNSMSEVLEVADVVTIHVDGKPSNRNLIADREFAQMKDGVLFLNASRGFVVDTESLAKYVKNGKVAGAALDVFPKEPKNDNESFESVLQNLPNVILTPHVGAGTQEAQFNIGEFVTSKIINFVNTGNTTLSVNLPEIHLSELNNFHRFIHIHQNLPGVLAKINNIIAKHGINIEGQYLKTNDYVGYVITDVSTKYSKEAISELKSIPETIKFRTLY